MFDEVSSPRQLTLTNLPDVVRNVSLFVKDLLTLLDRPTALELVYQLNDAIRANSDPLVQLLPRVTPIPFYLCSLPSSTCSAFCQTMSTGCPSTYPPRSASPTSPPSLRTSGACSTACDVTLLNGP